MSSECGSFMIGRTAEMEICSYSSGLSTGVISGPDVSEIKRVFVK